MSIIFLLFFSISYSSQNFNWVEINKDVFASKKYKISFNYEITDSNSILLIDQLGFCNIIFDNHKVLFLTNDKRIIVDKENIQMLNENTNQIFLDYSYDVYNIINSIDMISILSNSILVDSSKRNYYYYKYSDQINIQIYFSKRNLMDSLKVFYDNQNILNVNNLEVTTISKDSLLNYFFIDYDKFEMFDLREK